MTAVPDPHVAAERARLREAMVDLCFERGYKDLGLAELLARAGVSEEAFRRHYSGLEDCFCELVEEGRDDLLKEVVDRAFAEQGWRNQIRAAAYAMLRFLQADERRARLIIVEVHSAGTRAQLIRDQGIQLLFDLIDVGRNELPDPNSLTRATAESVGGAIYKRMETAIEAGDLSVGDRLVPELMYTVILPYRGTEAALAELTIPAPEWALPEPQGHAARP